MLKFDLRFKKGTEKMLSRLPKRYLEGLKIGMKQAMLFGEKKAKLGMGKVGRPKIRTGHLRRSIHSRVKAEQNLLVGSLYSDLIYSRIQEFGGFQKGNHWIGPLKARPYLEPAITQNLTKIQDIIRGQVVKHLEKR